MTGMKIIGPAGPVGSSFQKPNVGLVLKPGAAPQKGIPLPGGSRPPGPRKGQQPPSSTNLASGATTPQSDAVARKLASQLRSRNPGGALHATRVFTRLGDSLVGYILGAVVMPPSRRTTVAAKAAAKAPRLDPAQAQAMRSSLAKQGIKVTPVGKKGIKASVRGLVAAMGADDDSSKLRMIRRDSGDVQSIYLISAGQKCHILDADTMNAIGGASAVRTIKASDVDSYPSGPDIASGTSVASLLSTQLQEYMAIAQAVGSDPAAISESMNAPPSEDGAVAAGWLLAAWDHDSGTKMYQGPSGGIAQYHVVPDKGGLEVFDDGSSDGLLSDAGGNPAGSGPGAAGPGSPGPNQQGYGQGPAQDYGPQSSYQPPSGYSGPSWYRPDFTPPDFSPQGKFSLPTGGPQVLTILDALDALTAAGADDSSSALVEVITATIPSDARPDQLPTWNDAIAFLQQSGFKDEVDYLATITTGLRSNVSLGSFADDVVDAFRNPLTFRNI